jgi:hypothetical protein
MATSPFQPLIFLVALFFMHRSLVFIMVFALFALSAFGQARLGAIPRAPDPGKKSAGKAGEFTFVRTIYNSLYGGRRYGSWAVDYPEADDHFIIGVRDWSGTILNISAEPKQLEILNDKLFDYPLIYFVEPGFLELSEDEAKRLREYVNRGGFLFLDDFWGEYEWENVQEQMRRIFPEYKIEDLPLDHTIFHCYFDIREVIQVPGIGSWLNRGVTHEKGGITPHYMVFRNENGKILAFIARNCVLGDAWEWIDDQRYPLQFGLAAYRVGINVVIYAMSH